MELQHIRYFLELAKELHFWNTAEKVFITQSALSRHIKALEEELGFPLFIRDKRNVKLTAAGEIMQREWEKMLVQIDNIHQHAQQVHDGEFGSLRIGHPGSITYSALPQLTSTLTQKYPNIEVQLIEMMTIDLEKALLNFQMDIGFRREVSTNALLETRTLFAENFAVVVPNNHVVKANSLHDISAFKDENFILPDLKGSNSRYIKILRKMFKEAEFTPKINIVSEFGSTIMRLVNEGIGISILPISYANDINQNSNVRFISIPYSSYLYVQWRKDDSNPVLHNFVKIIESYKFTP